MDIFLSKDTFFKNLKEGSEHVSNNFNTSHNEESNKNNNNNLHKEDEVNIFKIDIFLSKKLKNE